MVEIILKSYEDWKDQVDTKSLQVHHYKDGSDYKILAIDGGLYYVHNLYVDDVPDFETNYLNDSNKKIEQFYQREPFASKRLKDGSSLFRRKQGKKETINANSSKEIIFTVPYSRARINKLEIIDANKLDRIDLMVKSPLDANTASLYGMPPNYLLNQFGFDVIVSELLYSDKSDYDAEVFAGFQIVINYKNDTTSNKEVGFNLIYHEVV